MGLHSRHWWQSAVDLLASHVELDKAEGLAPPQHRADSLADPAGSLGAGGPDRLNAPEHVGLSYAVHGHVSDNREDMVLQRLPPAGVVRLATPSRPVRVVPYSWGMTRKRLSTV